MGFQKIFPEILEKSYKNIKDVSTKNIPIVYKKSKIFGSKIIALPFIDTINTQNISKKDLPKEGLIEIKISEFNPNLLNLKKKLLQYGFKENYVKGHLISPLTNETDYWKRFHKHTRNDIRKAEKSGLIIKKIDSKIELEKFYKLYFKQMKNFGTPQHSFKFFKNCFEMMDKDFFGLNCYKGKKLIGSIILFVEKEYVYVSFNVSNEKFRNFRPNDFLYWVSLKWAMGKGEKLFDVGQIDFNPEKGSRAESLLKFKKKWLGKEYKKISFTKNFKYESFKKKDLDKFRKIWRLLPDFIIKLIGPKICSQLG